MRQFSFSDFGEKYSSGHFGANYGIGLIISQENEEFKTLLSGPQEVELIVDSWVGISAGAVHSYAKLRAFRNYKEINIKTGEENRVWCSNRTQPIEAEPFEIEIKRKNTKRDIKYAEDESDWYKPKLGDLTNKFWSATDAEKAAVKFFEKYFDGWILTSRVNGQKVNFITKEKL